LADPFVHRPVVDSRLRRSAIIRGCSRDRADRRRAFFLLAVKGDHEFLNASTTSSWDVNGYQRIGLDSEEKKAPDDRRGRDCNRELLRSDAIVINDGPMHETGRPTIVFGNRGNTLVAVTVYGPRVNLHSGHYGN